MLVYLSGKMTGEPAYGVPSFVAAAARLRELGHDVLNPAETAGGATHLPRATYFRIDAGYVMAAEALVVMAPKCWKSRGALLEMQLADALGKPIYLYSQLEGLGPQIEIKEVHVEWDTL